MLICIATVKPHCIASKSSYTFLKGWPNLTGVLPEEADKVNILQIHWKCIFAFFMNIFNIHLMTGGHSHLKTFPGRSGLCAWRWENVFLEIFDQPVKVVNLANEHERLQWREKLGEVLSEKTLYVSEVTLTNIHLLVFFFFSLVTRMLAGDEQVWVCTKNAKLFWSWDGLRHQLPRRAAPSFQGL